MTNVIYESDKTRSEDEPGADPGHASGARDTTVPSRGSVFTGEESFPAGRVFESQSQQENICGDGESIQDHWDGERIREEPRDSPEAEERGGVSGTEKSGVKAARRSLKVLPASFDRLELFCRQINVSMSSVVEVLLADKLGFEMPNTITVFGSLSHSHLTPKKLLASFNALYGEGEILPGYIEF